MIEIVSFGDINDGILDDVCKGIQSIFVTKCAVSKNTLEIPQKAYNEERKQYESTRFLLALQNYAKNSEADKILGITTEDLFTQNLNFIFGQAYINGRVCIMSLRRLDPKFYGREGYPLLLERAIKEAVHEIGHCFGLNHCNDKKCVMVFSNSIYDVDKKTAKFCKNCEEKI